MNCERINYPTAGLASESEEYDIFKCHIRKDEKS